MAKSNAGVTDRKANWKKPYPGFPLSHHPPSGRLYKKINGTRIYFGYADDWQAAIEKYQGRYAGRTPRTNRDGLTIRDLCNRFLTSKQRQLDCGEIVQQTFNDYKRTTDRLVAVLGKPRRVDDLAADDFERLRTFIAKTSGPVRLGNEITRTRVVFNYAAGISVVLGPISGVFVVDVDGVEAHRVLVERLGTMPRTPTVNSGSCLPNKYHLYFSHPPVTTRAKFTPWHAQLEFRGTNGLSILPPSTHPSGNRYAWAPGLSIDDVPLADVPAQICSN